MPVLALSVYGFMSRASGTWAWVFHGTKDLPAAAETPLLFKPVFALLAIHANQMLIRIARKPPEAPNGWMLWGLMLLLITPPVALGPLARRPSLGEPSHLTLENPPAVRAAGGFFQNG
jgi:hypothetical protein